MTLLLGMKKGFAKFGLNGSSSLSVVCNCYF